MACNAALIGLLVIYIIVINQYLEEDGVGRSALAAAVVSAVPLGWLAHAIRTYKLGPARRDCRLLALAALSWPYRNSCVAIGLETAAREAGARPQRVTRSKRGLHPRAAHARIDALDARDVKVSKQRPPRRPSDLITQARCLLPGESLIVTVVNCHGYGKAGHLFVIVAGERGPEVIDAARRMPLEEGITVMTGRVGRWFCRDCARTDSFCILHHDVDVWKSAPLPQESRSASPRRRAP